MLTLARRADRARKRAVSIIEAVLYLTVALAVIAAGIVFFNQANFAREVTSVSGMMSTMSAQLVETTRRVSRTASSPDFTHGDTTDWVVRAALVQSDMVSRGPGRDAIRMPWGGDVLFYEAAGSVDGRRVPVIAARLNDLPPAACIRLGQKNAAGNTRMGADVFALAVEENGVTGGSGEWIAGDVLYMALEGEETDFAALADACSDSTRDLVVYYAVTGIPDAVPSIGSGT